MENHGGDRGGDTDRRLGGRREHGGDELQHGPLEYLYKRFSTYIEDRRREPREDVLTGMANATFPDGSTPEAIDVARVASNVFSAGQETTVPLLSSALKVLGERPDIQQLLRRERDRVPNFIGGHFADREPGVKGDFRLARVATTVGGVDIPAGTTVMVLDGTAQPRSPPIRPARNLRRQSAKRPAPHRIRAWYPFVPRCTAGPRRGSGVHRTILDRTTDIRISRRNTTVPPMLAASNTFRPTSCGA